MRSLFVATIAFSVLAITAGESFAQFGTVQLPSLGRFSVSTTVVVPDRGRAFMGGVSRAAESTRRFGPLVRGSSKGLERSHSGVSTSAYIHDLREMDRRLLEQGRLDVARNSGPRLKGYAGHAYRSLTGRRQLADTRSSRRSTSAIDRYRRSSTTRDFGRTTTSSSRGDMYYRFALKAEASGNRAKAKALLSIAARHGSRAAQTKLAGGSRRTSNIPRVAGR